ncbi:hypothetical protein HN512_04345 [Candidatus Peregrinibacteria bacterium]|jgi:hypothetical protein|nr:hypothetical protein [Candidatus Peregrinibacteria bacterium]MBT3599038.1 hypothetical protein [Candidatus Peregrinibacteria bacterium]MBT4366944.1 hypothetical protein [Candidatus Peregrinibacteria bacterium]MBT4586269.1 hypothetical protein [Candidatus Peregrinibacteria bacterium]MBT6730656.1 hypothetical protein [Candidatus Peregrinibacteria bacterium]
MSKELQTGGFGPELLQHKPIFRTVFAKLWGKGMLNEIIWTSKDPKHCWNELCSDPEQMKYFTEVAIEAIEEGRFSFEEDFQIIEGSEGARLNKENIDTAVFGINRVAIKQISDVLNGQVLVNYHRGVVWESSSEAGKYNRVSITELCEGNNNWRMQLIIDKPGIRETFPILIANVSEEKLAEAFNGQDDPWTHDENEGWIGGEEVAKEPNAVYIFTRTITLKRNDGGNVTITWNGKHTNPESEYFSNPDEKKGFRVEDTLETKVS